jgi:hypothetical protein
MAQSVRRPHSDVGSLLVVFCLLAQPAEARFGKAGGHSSGTHGSSSSGGYHSASPVGQNHPATSGGGAPGNGASVGYAYSPGYSCWGDPYCPRYGWGFGYYPMWGYSPYYPSYAYTLAPAAPSIGVDQHPLVTTVEAQAQGYVGGGAGVGASVGFEKDRLGFNTRVTGIFVPSNDGSRGFDSIKLLDLHLTYAILANEHGRLRVGAGMDTAFAPDVVLAGPGLEVSGALGLIGSLTADGSVHVTPFPFTQLDWSAGLGIGWGAFGFRAGWRRIWLNDNGSVDNVAHTEIFSGPYMAVALAL